MCFAAKCQNKQQLQLRPNIVEKISYRLVNLFSKIASFQKLLSLLICVANDNYRYLALTRVISLFWSIGLQIRVYV